MVMIISIMLITFLVSVYVNTNNSYAASSTLELTISDSGVNVDVGTLSTSGVFKKSDVSTVSVKTNNATGYTLSIAASDSTYPQSLKNTSAPTDTSLMLSSIESNVDESDFSAITPVEGTVNRWGYYFIRHDSVAANATNTFSPAPTTAGSIIETTNVANPTTANEYDLAIGARIDSTVRIGSYANTYVVQLVGNAIPYTIIYNDNTVSNMPVDVSTTSASENINISSVVPVRDGYTFAGWCSVKPNSVAGVDTCTGTTYTAGQQVSLNQQSDTNNFNLYAMWTLNTPVNDGIYMQNVATWAGSLGINQEVTAVDIRDGKTYTVARLCMDTTDPSTNCVTGTLDSSNTYSTLWMTQNIDIVLGATGVRTLTSNDSDINTDLGSTMGYSTANGVITWTPSGSSMDVPATLNSGDPAAGNNANFVTGWGGVGNNNSSHTIAAQAEGGEQYVYTSGSSSNDSIQGSRWACIAADHTDAECKHYHIGNYYNWSAAVASNDTGAWGDSYSDGSNAMPYFQAANSICPKGWRLPKGLSGDDASDDNDITEFNRLALAYGITTGRTVQMVDDAASSSTGRWINVDFTTGGFNSWRTAPLYFVRSGSVGGAALNGYATNGYLWSSTARSGSIAFLLSFYLGELYGLYPASQNNRGGGFPVRCVLR